MKDFENHLGYKNNLQRIKKRRVPVLDGRAGHLPPIEDTNEETKENLLAKSVDVSAKQKSNETQQEK